MTTRDATFPSIDGLNPLFLSKHGLVLIAAHDGLLTVGMKDCRNLEAIAALRFATGMEIVPVSLQDPDVAGMIEGNALYHRRGPSLLDQALRRLGMGRDNGSVNADILLDEEHAQVLGGGPADRSISYDEVAEWEAAKADLAGKTRLIVMVAPALTLKVELAAVPRSEREFHEMLALSAPLELRNVVATDPITGESGVGSWITLVRRDWLDMRIAVIRRHFTPGALVVVDADLVPFRYDGVPRSRRLWAIGCAVTVAIALAAAWSWQMPRLPSKAQPSPTPTVEPSFPSSVAPALVQDPAPAQTNSDLVLLGIAGRLPDDADVLVKTPWGKTATMRVGDSLLGWKLISIASDRIVLEKDGARDQLVLEPAP